MFKGPSFQGYYLDAERMTSALLAKETPEYLIQVDPDEYLQHLVEQLAWEPLEWDESGMTMEPFIARRKINDPYGGRELEVEEPRLRIRLPVTRHPQLRDYLKLQPSSQRLDGEPAWNFQGDILVLEAKADERDVDRVLEQVRFWLGGRNNEIIAGNAELPKRVAAVWRAKRSELERQVGLLKTVVERLKIPLHQDATAPKPVALRRVSPKSAKPLAAPKRMVEPELEREDVLGLVAFVESYSRQLEVTPEVYSKLGEEELRDLVLGMLNVNYPGSTGESFSKLGKTDMLLRVSGEGSLIIECKKWKGQKHYGESLDQLFRYLTWRHGYGILLTFSTSKGMTAIVDAATLAMNNHASTVSGGVQRVSSSRFGSRHLHPQDQAKTVEIFHLFTDIAT